MSKEILLDRAAAASPSVGYLGLFFSGASIQDFVAILTGVFILLQIFKIAWELIDKRAAKRKELASCSVPKEGS